MAKHKRMEHQPRSLSALARTSRQRPPRKTTLIVCEGKRTEPTYFRSLCRALRLSSIAVRIVGQGAAPISVVNTALAIRRAAKRDRAPFDEVWCVFDREHQHRNPSFYPAVDKARANKISLAVSNPAFEFWYLLHFTETSKPFADFDDLKKALDVFLPNYEKNVDWFDKLSEQTDKAIERAAHLWSQRLDPQDEFPNPSTGVHHLARLLKAIVNS